MIIDATKLREYKKVSNSTPAIDITQAIEIAEMENVLPLLGEKLYYDIEKNKSSYQALLDGCEYVYDGYTYRHKGLNIVIAYFAYAHLIVNKQVQDTPFGLVSKTSQDTQIIDQKSLNDLAKDNQRTALTFFDLTKLYLTRNSAQYPLFGECGSVRGNFRVSIIR